MSTLTPSTPASFPAYYGRQPIAPVIKYIKSENTNWFNQRGAKIIESKFDRCTGEVSSRKYPWGIPPCLTNENIWPCPINLVNNFWQYGTHPVCPCGVNRCSCSNNYQQHRCAINGGSYVNPN